MVLGILSASDMSVPSRMAKKASDTPISGIAPEQVIQFQCLTRPAVGHEADGPRASGCFNVRSSSRTDLDVKSLEQKAARKAVGHSRDPKGAGRKAEGRKRKYSPSLGSSRRRRM